MKRIFFIMGFLFFASISKSNIVLPSIFGDNMVLQQNSKVKIWGWAKPFEKITISTSWNNDAYKDTTNNHGNFEININTPSFGGPFEIKIEGYNTILLSNVMIGEVWLVSGQSNMEWSASSGIDNGKEEVKNANYPNIRLLTVSTQSAKEEQLNFYGNWQICTPKSMEHFSAVGYAYARSLHENLNIPIGIINSSWGGTPAEAWMPKSAIEKDPVLLKDAILQKEVPWGPVFAGSIYNAMISPFTKFEITGVLWYQGESNVHNANNYDRLLATLVTEWRKAWNKNFPFYYAQIAPYRYGKEEEGVKLRNAQRKALDIIPNSDMIVLTDIGNVEDIHPQNKIDVGKRFANLALNKYYKKSNKACTEPRLKEYTFHEDNITLTFQSTGSLVCDEKCKNAFEICGLDDKYYKAIPKIEGNRIVLHSNSVKLIKNARFSWSNISTEILTDDSGLPCSSFILVE